MATLMAVTFTACDEGTPPPIEPEPPPDPVGMISGTVTIDGSGAAGLTATLSSGATQTTNTSGAFTFADVVAGSYTVTISGHPEDVTFPAATQSATIASNGQTVQLNFPGQYIRSSSVVGNVVASDAMMSATDSAGQPDVLAGVTVTLTGDHAMAEPQQTDMSTGGFAFTGLRAGTYTVEISGFPEDVAFDEVSMTVEVGVGDVGKANFEGAYIRTAAVEGRVIIEGEGLAGVTVTLVGGPGNDSYTKMTGDNGEYAFADLRPGDYQVSISGYDPDDYEFASNSHDVSVDLDETETVSFTGVLLRTSGISGRVSVEGMGLPDIAVTLSGAADASAMTDASGQYAFAGLAAGDYTVSIAVASNAYVFDSMSEDKTLGDDDTQIVNFEGAHDTSASLSVMLFIDELDNNDMHDDGEDVFPSPAMLQALQAAQVPLPPMLPVPVTLVGPAVNQMRSGSLNVATGQITFSDLREGSYRLQVGSLSQLLAGLPPQVAAVLRDYEYGGPAEGYAIPIGVAETATHNVPVDITHTTVNFRVALKHGDDDGPALEGATVTLFSDAAGDTKIDSGETGADGTVAIRFARAGTSGNMVHAGVAVEGYHVVAGMTPVPWNPQLPFTVGANANDIVNLNVNATFSGATLDTGADGGGEALADWEVSVMMGDDEVDGASATLDEDGVGTFEGELEFDDLPVTYTVSLADDQNDELDGGEEYDADDLESEYKGLALAGEMDIGTLEATYTTQTLKVYVHRERDQVEGFTGNVLGGDERMSGMLDVEVRYVAANGRSRAFTKAAWDADENTDDAKGVLTFTGLPADEDVIVTAEAAEDANVIVVGSAELAAYEDLVDNGVMGGAFGAMGGGSHTVSLCPLQRTSPQDHDECASFAFVNTYSVDGQAWKNGVERDDDDDFDLHLSEDDDPAAVEGITVTLDPVTGKNLAGESESFTTADKDDKDTKGIDDTKQFDFGQMADGVYAIGVPSGWVAKAGTGGAKLPAEFLLESHLTSDEDEDEADDHLNIDVTPATGVLYGRVVDSDDLAAEGVTVNVNGQSDVTDEFGRYIVEGFSAKKNKDKKDAMIVKASGDGFAEQTDTIAGFAANTPTPHNFSVVGAADVATISGTVTKSGSGDGEGGVKIAVSDNSELLNANEKSSSSKKKNDIYLTDDDGNYTVQVRAVDAGESVTVTASKKGHSFSPPSHSVPAPADANRPGYDFVAFDHATITGRVRLGEDGPPVAGVKVTATLVGETEPADDYTTRATGTFRLSVPFGTYNIAADEASGHTFAFPNGSMRVTVAPGTTVSFGDIIATESGNFPPAFTSDAEFEVEEGETEIGEVEAEDPDDDDYIKEFEILTGAGNGADGSLMSIDDETGELTFNAAPDFDKPADDGKNNVYEVTVQVTSGGSGTGRDLTATQDIDVTVTSTDEYEVTIVLTPDEISEGGGESVVTATVDPASPTAFAVNVTVNGSSDDGDAYEISSNKTLFFAADAEESTGSVSITAVNNNDHNDDVEVKVGGDVVPGSLEGYSVEEAELTIEDDDVAPPQVTLSLRPSRIDEGGEVELRVSLTKLFVNTDGEPEGVNVSLGADWVEDTGDDARTSLGTISFSASSVEIPAGRTTPAADTDPITLTAPDNDEANGDWMYKVGGTATNVSDADSVTLRVSDDDETASAPRNLTITAGDASLTAEWISPADGGTSARTNYQYRAYETDEGAPEADAADQGWETATSPQNITTLVNDTKYTVEVRAVSAAGDGAIASATGTPKASS